MRKSAWYMILSAAALAGTVGCGDSGVDPCAPGSGMICPVDSGTEDAEVPPPDTGPLPDRPMSTLTCGDVGRTGGHCRDGTCFTGLECAAEFERTMAAIGYVQARPEDPANPVTFVPVETPTPAEDVILRFATDSMCTQDCDTSAATDTCGTCAKCSQTVGGAILNFPPTFLYDSMSTIDPRVAGVCRAHCVFEVDGNGVGCPDGFTCDPLSNLCIEACANDAQCNATPVLMETLEVGTWIVPDGGRTCSATTGRCESPGTPAAQVGTPCESSDECAPDVGFCLRGGTCAVAGCDPSTALCDGDRGLCVPNGGNNAGFCAEGCDSAEDCNPGNACLSVFADPTTMVGGFTGICLGICDVVDSGVIDGRPDAIINCRADEECDMGPVTDDDADPDGTCRSTCDPAAVPSACEADEVCEAVAGETYGFCQPVGNICADSFGCYNGQICDNEIGAPTYGRCVDPCAADTDCTVGAATTCVTDTANVLVGLCAETCTMSTECNEGAAMTRVCRTAVGDTVGYCVEAPAP